MGSTFFLYPILNLDMGDIVVIIAINHAIAIKTHLLVVNFLVSLILPCFQGGVMHLTLTQTAMSA